MDIDKNPWSTKVNKVIGNKYILERSFYLYRRVILYLEPTLTENTEH